MKLQSEYQIMIKPPELDNLRISCYSEIVLSLRTTETGDRHEYELAQGRPQQCGVPAGYRLPIREMWRIAGSYRMWRRTQRQTGRGKRRLPSTPRLHSTLTSRGRSCPQPKDISFKRFIFLGCVQPRIKTENTPG